jgi:hypothetical protein
MSKNERNFRLDLMMFLVFMVTLFSGLVVWLVIPGRFSTSFAGIDRTLWLGLHIGSGLTGLCGVIVHIVWHRDWQKTLRGRPLAVLKKPVRANRLINRLAWFAFIDSNVFGLLAWLLPASLPHAAILVFSRLHLTVSLVWVVLLVIHLGLHQKWIALAARRFSIGKTDNAGVKQTVYNNGQ